MPISAQPQSDPAIPDGVLRHEDYRLITGTGKFTADWQVDGQLHGAMIRSAVAHAEITSIDLAAASESPGVVCILSLIHI